MAKGNSRLDTALNLLPALSRGERKKLLEGLCQYPDALEDLRDILILLDRQAEPSRPYEEFVAELRAQGRL